MLRVLEIDVLREYYYISNYYYMFMECICAGLYLKANLKYSQVNIPQIASQLSLLSLRLFPILLKCAHIYLFH